MKSDIKKGLDDVFAKHEASRKAAAERQQAIQTKEEAFLKEFLEKRDSIIRPAMEAVGQYLKEKGYSSEITTEEDGYSQDGARRPVSASIRFTIYPDRGAGYPRERFPGLAAICDKSGGRVVFHESTLSPSRGAMPEVPVMLLLRILRRI
jgi:hypothetical protein